MSNQDPQSLTVEQLRDFLNTLIDSGQAQNTIVIPYKTPHETVGGRPSMPITSIQSGFDWEQGKVFLNPSKPLATPIDSIMEKMKSQQQQISRILMLTRYLGQKQSPPLEEQVEVFKEQVKSIILGNITQVKSEQKPNTDNDSDAENTKTIEKKPTKHKKLK